MQPPKLPPVRPTPPAPQTPAVDVLWRVGLLGGVQLDGAAQTLHRLPSRAVAALLARLALWPQRLHAREELVELLWPGVTLVVGRNRLRQALSTLKSMLEPPGQPALLRADRLGIRVVAGSLQCDVHDFEALVREGRASEARAVYRGELMPGFYDEWIVQERLRLAALHEHVAEAAPMGPQPPPSRPAAPSADTGLADAANVAWLRPRLPSYLTRYFGAEPGAAQPGDTTIGRDRDRDRNRDGASDADHDRQAGRLRQQVLAHRLVTLLGPGGAGKTRLAVELAHVLRAARVNVEAGVEAAVGAGAGAGAGLEGKAPPQRFDTVAFAALVACSDSAQMLSAIQAGLRSAGDSAVSTDRLVAALADTKTLLVLDNFEQLVDTAAPVVGELLARLPGLHVLVTSRRALGLDGEREFAIAPLAVPDAGAAAAQAANNPAVALFVDRARAVRTDFHLGARNTESVVALVRWLHGMPLAIELAASRVRSMAPGVMLQRLRSAEPGAGALDLLARSGPRGGLDPRHASMRPVIDWSWHLLDSNQRSLLAHITVFDGSFSAAAAAQVAGSSSPAAVADHLDQLAAHSLLRVVSGGDGSPRLVLDEVIREFASEALPAEAAKAARSRHRAGLVGWAQALGRAAPLSKFDDELANVYGALRSAHLDAAPLDALELALALRTHWESAGTALAQMMDIEAALRAASARADTNTPALRALRSRAHELLSYQRFEAGFADAAATHAQAALDSAGNDPSLRAHALVRSAWVQLAAYRGDASSAVKLQEALQLAKACGDLEAQARALHQLAIVAANQDDDRNAAEALFAKSQALWEQLGDRAKVYARLRNRAQCWFTLGRREEALASYEACEAAAAQAGDFVGLVDSTLSRGIALSEMRRWQQAAAVLARCTALAWGRHHVHGLAYALWNQARVLARLRQPEAAGRLMAFAEDFWAARIGPVSGTGPGTSTAPDTLYQRRVRALVQAQVGPARAQMLAVEGRLMNLAAAVAIAGQTSA